jgi:hypothetical protein
MITPINHRQFGVIRGGAASNTSGQAGVTDDPSQHTEERSPLARNIEAIVRDAYSAGRHHGEAQHFRQGWRWGLVAGLFWGGMSGASLVLLLQWIGAA